jgi:hypothetical protein
MRLIQEMCSNLNIANLLSNKTAQYQPTLLRTARDLLTESLAPDTVLLDAFEEPLRLAARCRCPEKKTWQHRAMSMATISWVILFMVLLLLPIARNGHANPDEIQPDDTPRTRYRSEYRSQGTEDTTKFRRTGLYLREIVHSDSYIFWKMTESEILDETETWIGDRTAARIEKDRTFIVDLIKNTFTLVNHREESYIEAPLPLEMLSLLSGDMRTEYEAKRVSAVVRRTRRTKTILHKKCKEYRLMYWDMRGKAKSNQRNIRLWATTEVHSDLDAYGELLESLRRFHNRDETARRELDKIEGLQLRNETGYNTFFVKRKIVEEAVELSEREIPEDIFSLPDDYVKREYFIHTDFPN